MEPRSDPHHGRCNEGKGNLLNDPLVGVEVDNGLGVLDDDTSGRVTERRGLGNEISDIRHCSSRDGSFEDAGKLPGFSSGPHSTLSDTT